MKASGLKALVLAAALVGSAAHAGQPAVSFSGTNSSFLDGNTRMIGWQFGVPKAVEVTSLGWFDWGQDGLARSHEVGIWNSATQELVARAVVPDGTAAALQGYFRWVDLDAPVTLLPGVSYRIAGLDIGAGGDPHVWDKDIGAFGAHVNGFSVDAAVQLSGAGAAIGGLAGGFSYPAALIGDARSALLGPNFAVSAVPEPAAALLLAAGLAMLSLRRRSLD